MNAAQTVQVNLFRVLHNRVGQFRGPDGITDRDHFFTLIRFQRKDAAQQFLVPRGKSSGRDRGNRIIAKISRTDFHTKHGNSMQGIGFVHRQIMRQTVSQTLILHGHMSAVLRVHGIEQQFGMMRQWQPQRDHSVRKAGFSGFHNIKFPGKQTVSGICHIVYAGA